MTDVTILAAEGLTGLGIEIIGFAIVFGVLARYIVPLVSKAMAARQAAIAKQLADSEAASRKLAEAQAAYDNAIAEARAEADRLRADARIQHQAIVDEAAAAARSRAEEITARAREQLEAERVSAVRSLQAEIATLTVELAERKVLDSLGDDALQRRVTARFLDELETMAPSTATQGTPGVTAGVAEPALGAGGRAE